MNYTDSYESEGGHSYFHHESDVGSLEPMGDEEEFR